MIPAMTINKVLRLGPESGDARRAVDRATANAEPRRRRRAGVDEHVAARDQTARATAFRMGDAKMVDTMIIDGPVGRVQTSTTWGVNRGETWRRNTR